MIENCDDWCYFYIVEWPMTIKYDCVDNGYFSWKKIPMPVALPNNVAHAMNWNVATDNKYWSTWNHNKDWDNDLPWCRDNCSKNVMMMWSSKCKKGLHPKIARKIVGSKPLLCANCSSFGIWLWLFRQKDCTFCTRHRYCDAISCSTEQDF